MFCPNDSYAKTVNEHYTLHICSHGLSLLGKFVFVLHKSFSCNLPIKVCIENYVFCKKILFPSTIVMCSTSTILEKAIETSKVSFSEVPFKYFSLLASYLIFASRQLQHIWFAEHIIDCFCLCFKLAQWAIGKFG